MVLTVWLRRQSEAGAFFHGRNIGRIDRARRVHIEPVVGGVQRSSRAGFGSHDVTGIHGAVVTHVACDKSDRCDGIEVGAVDVGQRDFGAAVVRHAAERDDDIVAGDCEDRRANGNGRGIERTNAADRDYRYIEAKHDGVAGAADARLHRYRAADCGGKVDGQIESPGRTVDLARNDRRDRDGQVDGIEFDNTPTQGLAGFGRFAGHDYGTGHDRERGGAVEAAGGGTGVVVLPDSCTGSGGVGDDAQVAVGPVGIAPADDSIAGCIDRDDDGNIAAVSCARKCFFP